MSSGTDGHGFRVGDPVHLAAIRITHDVMPLPGLVTVSARRAPGRHELDSAGTLPSGGA